MPTAALLSTFGAVYGSTWVSTALALVPGQVCSSPSPLLHHCSGPVTSGLAVLYLCTEATPQETLQSVSNVLRCLCLCKTNLQCHLQVLAALPIARHVAGFYSHHPGFCDMLTNTAFSLAAALFVFIILPAGDFIIGVEPPEVVRLQLQPSCTVNGHDYLLLLCGHPPLLIQCASLLICW